MFSFQLFRCLLVLFCVLVLQGCNSAVEGIDTQTPNTNKSDDSSCTASSPSLVQYFFNENTGSGIVNDSSGLVPAINLTIQDPNFVSWLSNGLAVNRSTIILSDTTQNTANRVVEALRISNQLTVEMWIEPENTTQSGPARIVSISEGYYDRNLTIGQEANKYTLRLRTSTTSLNGKIYTSSGEINPMTTDPGTVRTVLTHLVLTWDTTTAVASYYIDGSLSSSVSLDGDFSTWSDGYPLLISNEVLDGRTWLGNFYYLAIYDCAMDATEIANSYNNGIPIVP
jgi:hypothetical protein